MTRPAFSLVELLVGLALGTLVLAGVLRAGGDTVRAARRQQDRVHLRLNLALAHGELGPRLRDLEPDFWRGFPRTGPAPHPVTHRHGALDYHDACPDHPANACVTLWDLALPTAPAPVSTVVAHDWPNLLRLAPVDGAVGSYDVLGPQSVLLLVHETGAFPVLLAACLVDETRLVPLPEQPWPLPETLPPDVEVVPLGTLAVTHLGLEPTPDAGARLTYRPWVWDDGWRHGRRLRTIDFLDHLLWQPCTPALPDRLTLTAQPPRPGLLSYPVFPGGRRYDTEVAHVGFEF